MFAKADNLTTEQPPVLPSRDTMRHISTFRDPTQTYLESPWTLWLVNKMGSQNKTWLDCIHPVATFSTIQQFWGMYNTLKPPSELPVYWEYALFRGGLGRRVIVPDWDDHENVGGGCMQLTGFNLDSKIIDHLWRDICLKVIEEAWIHTSDYINGVMVSAKSGTTRFYVWVAPCKEHVWESVRDRIEGVFSNECRTPMKWTPHMERKTMMDSKVAAKRAKPRTLERKNPAERPSHFRSRSVGYRAKLAEDARAEEFLESKRFAPLESKEAPATATAAPSKRLINVRASQSSIMLRMGAGDSYHQQYNMQRPRGRSAHGFKPYAEYPMFSPPGDVARRVLGQGDMAFKYFSAQREREDAVKNARMAKEMVDVSTQYMSRGTNAGAGDSGDIPVEPPADPKMADQKSEQEYTAST